MKQKTQKTLNTIKNIGYATAFYLVSSGFAGGKTLPGAPVGQEYSQYQNSSKPSMKTYDMKELLSLARKEYSADLEAHMKIASGEINADDNKGGLMPNTSTYIMSIGGKLLAHTMDKDSLEAHFGFRNFPAEWRSQQLDRHTKDIVGSNISQMVGGSDYTEALIYGKEVVANGVLKSLGGIIAIFTLDDNPSQKNSAYVFHMLGEMKNGKPVTGQYGTLIEQGKPEERFLAKINGKPNPLYDPYAVMQQAGCDIFMTKSGETTHALIMPPGFSALFDSPIPLKIGSKTEFAPGTNSLEVKQDGELAFTQMISMIEVSKDFKLSGTLGTMSNDDKLTHVILSEGDGNGVGLEQALGIEQKENAFITDRISADDMKNYMKTDKLGGREENKIPLGTGYYPILDGSHGAAWVTSTPNGVYVIYAKSNSDLLRCVAIPTSGQEDLWISNPDAPLNQRKPIFKVSNDGSIIALLTKQGTLKVFYTKECFYLEVKSPKELAAPSLDIDDARMRVVLSDNDAEVRSLGKHEALYKYIGEALKYRVRQ